MNTEISRKSPRVAIGPCLGMALLLPLWGHAQESSVFVDIGPCMSRSPDAARYACYDELEAAIRQAQQQQSEAAVPVLSPPARSPAPDSLEHEATAEDALADFGRTTPATAGSARLEANGEGEQVLHDRVLSLRERVPGQWLITLESGQVWSQSNSENFRLRKGMDVTIYPSPLGGSYRLSISGMNGFIQVRRIE